MAGLVPAIRASTVGAKTAGTAPGKPSPQAPDFHIDNVSAYRSRFKE